MSARFGFQVTVKERAIWVFPEDVDAALAAAKAQANAAASNASAEAKRLAKAGIAYGWTRGVGEEPISLGSFDDLTGFVDDNILGNLPAALKPDFKVTESFDALVGGLPDPVNGAVKDLKAKAVFELDSLRLKIPGKGSDEKMQFEIAMLINLMALPYSLGPFKLNQLYARLGNF